MKTEWQIADGISLQNTLYYLNSKRHWKDVESYAYNPATGLINRSSYIEIFHDQQQFGNRMDAKFRGHVFGMVNEFVAGFDVNSINFTHTNNSPFGGTSSVNPYNFVPGVFNSPNATVPGFGSVTNQYALFAENRLSVTEQLSLIAGIRQDEPTVTRTDYVSAANSFEKSFSSTTWRAGRCIRRSRISPSTANIPRRSIRSEDHLRWPPPTRTSNWPPASRSRSASSNRSGAAAANGPWPAMRS